MGGLLAPLILAGSFFLRVDVSFGKRARVGWKAGEEGT